MGSKIKCNFCKEIFGKILCPSCLKLNICTGGEEDFFKLGLMKCSHCFKENYMINCLFCKKLNYFNKRIPIKGQIIKCGYCHNTFNEIFCPFCKLVNPFPLADFSFGKVYKCKYLNCFKKFKFDICPKCLQSSFTRDTEEGKKLKCLDCNILFMNWGCPFCGANTLDKNPSYEIGQMLKCPSKECGKIYSFIKCSKCHKLIFSQENENILGKSVKCPYQGCGVYTLINKCPLCNIKIKYSGGERPNYNEGDNITCPSCKKNYIFQKRNEIYDNNLTCLEKIEGKTIDFGVDQIDDNYLFKQDLFFYKVHSKRSILISSQFTSGNYSNSDEIEIKKSQSISKVAKECILCHNNIRESIFYPCGHRCTCYNCAMIFFTVNKKCPECKQDSECIIKKIYD